MLASCKQRVIETCENKACTLNLVTITMQFVDKNGDGVALKDYSAVNLRTNDTIGPAGANVRHMRGYYAVVDDSYLLKLSAKGDQIRVTGTDSVSNQTKSATIKVAGGRCACHVTKLSGPDKIQFD